MNSDRGWGEGDGKGSGHLEGAQGLGGLLRLVTSGS